MAHNLWVRPKVAASEGIFGSNDLLDPIGHKNPIWTAQNTVHNCQDDVATRTLGK